MALIMVVSVIAVCSVLGLALLAGSSKQVILASNAKSMSQARYAAESGIQIAAHYLQFPGEAPAGTTTSGGIYRGQGGIALAGGQSVDVTVADEGDFIYLITATGRVTAGQSASDHTLRCRVKVLYQYVQDYAAGFANNVYLPAQTSISGEIRCDGLLWLANNTVQVVGTARYRSLWGILGLIGNPQPLAWNEPLHFPSVGQIRDYTGTYTYQGKTYTAQKLTVTSLSNTTIPTAAQRVTNPAGLFWTNQSLDLLDNVRINGMIRSTSGNIRVRGRSIVINRTEGFPALVINDSLVFSGGSRQITINGLTWVGGEIGQSGLSSHQLTINGALISQGGINLFFNGAIAINYQADKVNVPDFSGVNAVPAAVRIINYNPPQ